MYPGLVVFLMREQTRIPPGALASSEESTRAQSHSCVRRSGVRSGSSFSCCIPNNIAISDWPTVDKSIYLACTVNAAHVVFSQMNF